MRSPFRNNNNLKCENKEMFSFYGHIYGPYLLNRQGISTATPQPHDKTTGYLMSLLPTV